ncbi:MAG: hypothetical protein ACKOWF_12550 [Chloroflexota bacterium]
MEIVIALVFLFCIFGVLGSDGARPSDEEMERRRRFNANMAMMDSYNVGPFRNDGPGQ